MSTPKRAARPISMAATVAFVLGVAALLLIPVAAARQPFALILASAAIVIGGVVVLNARRINGRWDWVGLSALTVGLVGAVWVLIVRIT